ncbi:MAG: DUF2191 domain-containing protein [Spirochaetaceae bacterium]|nr:MAG: DUF2191 domain-containing protein [Spirochaetaceae bacterium]
MKTTLNIPDNLVRQAKLIALRDGRTLTDMLVSGLSTEIARSERPRELPVCTSGGGVVPGVDWLKLQTVDADEWHR